MYNRKKRLITPSGLFFLFMAVWPLTAHAGGLMSQVAGILSNYIDPSDESVAMLKYVFGDFSINPFETRAPGSSTLMGAMFMNYNMYIFTIATIWLGYNALSGLAHTMHEGVVLGRRMSTIWVPIRVTFGAVSLMPAFGGWALCQALMMVATMLGIAGANYITKTAIMSTSNFKMLVNPMGSVKQAANLNEIEKEFLRGIACTRSAEKLAAEQSQYGVRGSVSYSIAPVINGDKIYVNFPGMAGPTGCGSIRLEFSPRTNSTFFGKSTFGFRINNINYTGIRMVSMYAHEETLKQVQVNAEKIVKGANQTTPGPAIAEATSILQSGYYGSYSTIFQQKLQKVTTDANGVSNIGALESDLLTNMLSGGWSTLGTWYSVFAETNATMNEMLDPNVVITEPLDSKTSVYEDSISGTNAMGDIAISNTTSTPGNATGNASIGQFIMGGVLTGMMAGGSTGASDTVNPILAFKTMGDNALPVIEMMFVAIKVMEAVVPEKGSAGDKLTDVAGAVTGTGAILSMLKSLARSAAAMLTTIAMILFATACVMSIYIPMIPFIQWFAGLLQWFTSIIESLIGSSLWMLAHFDADGDGMGQRASYGYLYLLNNFARPIIMVFAFFVASSAITVLGTFLFKYFGNAVAAAQGNSITGLVSIVGFLVLFTIMGISLINGAFNLMLHMANKMIGWIGQAGNAMEHDIEGRINSVFLAAGTQGRTLLAGGGAGGGQQGGKGQKSLKEGVHQNSGDAKHKSSF